MTDERIIAYLLKELPDEEAERFEDECFARESWPPEISAVEEDLIDAYLRGELGLEQRRRFEQNYLTTEARCARVRVAAALLRRVDEHPAAAQTADATARTESGWMDWWRAFLGGQNFALRAGLAAVLAIVVAGALWLFLIRSRAPQTFATLNLTLSATSRGEGNQAARVRLPIKEEALKISLKLPEGSAAAARYRVLLLDAQGEIRQLEVAGQDNQSVSVVVPTAQLERGPYGLQVFLKKDDGTEERIPGTYLFTVE